MMMLIRGKFSNGITHTDTVRINKMARDYEAIVNNLFAKAAAEGVTPAEKEILENKAFELMSRYSIKRAVEEGTKSDILHGEVEFHTTWAAEYVRLFNVVSSHFNCRLIQSGKKYHLFGYGSDMDSVEFLYGLLANQMSAEMARATIPYGVHAKTFRHAWMTGYISRIRERLEATKKSAEKDNTPGSALVLYDREKLVNKEVRNEFPRLTTKTTRYRSRDAFAQGQAAGDRAYFNVQGNITGGKGELT
jgi:hypothetical protein